MRVRSGFLSIVVATLFLIGLTGGLSTAFADKDEKSKGTFLGVFLEELNQDNREALEYTGENGILIASLVDDGPAEEAGIESGDVLIELDGVSIASIEELRKVLAKHQPGDKIKAVVFRDGKAKKIKKIKLGEKPRQEKAITKIPKIKILKNHYMVQENRAYLGVEIESLEGQLAEYFGVKEGVLIESVADETPAQKAGFKAGDVITKVAGKEVEDGGDLLEALGEFKPGDEVEFVVVRKGKEMTMKAALAERPCGSSDCEDCEKHLQFLIGADDDELIDIDLEGLEGLGDILRDALKDVDIDIDDADFQEDFEEFRQELKRLREDMDKLKEQMEKKK